MIDCIKVSEHPDNTGNRTCDQIFQISFADPHRCLAADQRADCDHKRKKIPEEALLQGRYISRQADKQIHQRKTKSRFDNKQDTERCIRCLILIQLESRPFSRYYITERLKLQVNAADRNTPPRTEGCFFIRMPSEYQRSTLKSS